MADAFKMVKTSEEQVRADATIGDDDVRTTSKSKEDQRNNVNGMFEDERTSTARNSKTRGFFTKVRQDGAYRIRLIHTGAVMWMFVSLGWLISIFGATFPDIRLIIDKDLETASWLGTAQNLGYLVGALVFGVLFDKVNRLLLLTAIPVLAAVVNGIFPWCSNFVLMLGVQVIAGIMNGGIDVGGNSHVASIWGRHAAPFMQWVHFGFSVGGIPSPLTADPFLAEKVCVPTNDTSTAAPDSSSVSSTASSDSLSCVETYGTTHIQYAYLIAAFVTMSSAVPFLVLYALSGRKETYVDTAYEDHDAGMASTETHLPDLSLSLKIIIVTCLMSLIALYAASEGRYSGLLSTFVTEELEWSTTDGNHVTSLFWGTFAAGRFVGIFVTGLLPPSRMIAVYLLSLNLSFIGFFFGAFYDIDAMIWTFSGTAGFSMSIIFPSIFAWTAESVINVTGKISAFYLVGVSVWNTVLPLLYGYMMDNYTDMYFIYLLIGQSVICYGLYVLIQVLSNIYIKPRLVAPDTDGVKTVA